MRQPSWNMPGMWGRKLQILGVTLGQTLGQTLHFWGWLSQREPSSHGQSCHLGRLWTHWEGGSLSHSIALTSYSSSAPPASCQAKSALGLCHWLANTRNAREPWAPPSSAASGQTGRNVPSQLHTGEPGRPTDAEGHCSFTMLTAVSTFPAASLPRDRSLSPLTWARWLWDQRIVPCAPTTAIMSRSENRLLSAHGSFLEGPFSRAFISTVCC